MTTPLLRPPIPGTVAVLEPVMATPEYAAALADFSQRMPAEQAAEEALRVARKAARPDAYAVVACTLVFGVFGAVSAARRAGRANALALPFSRYWVAYLGTMAVWALVFAVVARSAQ